MEQYYYALDNERRGPVSLEQLRAAPISRHTLVWREGMPDWVPAREFDELADLFRDAPGPALYPSPAAQEPRGYPDERPPRPAPGGMDLGGRSGGYPAPIPSPQPLPRRTAYDQLAGPPPKTWLVESILVTVLCCLPFGIAGIVNASKVESCHFAGDVEGAAHYSRQAGKWTKIAFGLGIAGYLLYIVFVVLVGVGSAFG